jgi:hypothetical protein
VSNFSVNAVRDELMILAHVETDRPIPAEGPLRHLRSLLRRCIAPVLFRIASAIMERAELRVVRKRTLYGRSVMTVRLQLAVTAQQDRCFPLRG